MGAGRAERDGSGKVQPLISSLCLPCSPRSVPALQYSSSLLPSCIHHSLHPAACIPRACIPLRASPRACIPQSLHPLALPSPSSQLSSGWVPRMVPGCGHPGDLCSHHRCPAGPGGAGSAGVSAGSQTRGGQRGAEPLPFPLLRDEERGSRGLSSVWRREGDREEGGDGGVCLIAGDKLCSCAGRTGPAAPGPATPPQPCPGRQAGRQHRQQGRQAGTGLAAGEPQQGYKKQECFPQSSTGQAMPASPVGDGGTAQGVTPRAPGVLGDTLQLRHDPKG